MTCKKCGRPLMQDAKFCDGCGAAVEESNTPSQTNNNRKRRKVKTYTLIVIFLLAVIGIIGGMIRFTQKNREANSIVATEESVTPSVMNDVSEETTAASNIPSTSEDDSLPEIVADSAQETDMESGQIDARQTPRYSFLVCYLGDISDELNDAIDDISESELPEQNECDIQLGVTTIHADNHVQAVKDAAAQNENAIIICDPNAQITDAEYYEIYQWTIEIGIPVLIIRKIVSDLDIESPPFVVRYESMIVLQTERGITESLSDAVQITLNLLMDTVITADTSVKTLETTEGYVVQDGDLISLNVVLKEFYDLDGRLANGPFYEDYGTGEMLVGTGYFWRDNHSSWIAIGGNISDAADNYIVGRIFDDQLIGHAVGETFEISVPAPIWTGNSAGIIGFAGYGTDVYDVTINGVYK